MAADYAPRRTSAVAAPSSAANPPIPPPPPLPPARNAPQAAASSATGSRGTSYFSRFVTQPLTTAYGSRPPSAQTNRPNGGRPNPLVPRLPGVSSGSSQDASHKTGLEISAVDINRERTHAILAGREILKTIRIEDAKCAEETNLRAAIINYAAHSTTTSAARREALEIHDVKWSHGRFNTHIATAATNGKVILYDLNRAGVELARLHEHHRQVHKLAFNPHQGYLLLSASQDATVRLWDLRDLRKEFMTCPSRDKFSGLSEGIRDVQWSPTDGVEFAFGTDNGTIQRWDFRHTKGPKLKLSAHEQKTCTSIDWHPDGKHLLSAGVDKTIRIWDFYSENRRQKPAYVIRTPYPVFKARWRPPYWSDEVHEKGVYQSTQLATSYDRDHSPVHVWDFQRPHMPVREVIKYSSAPSDLLWHSHDFLWTVGREGVFTQTDVHFAPRVLDRRNLQAFAVSPSGEIAGFAQRRPGRRRSGLDYSAASTEDTYMDERQRSSPDKSLRNSAEDNVDDGFLGSTSRRHHGRSASNRSAKSLASTPETAPKVMYLTDSLLLQKPSSKPNQVAFRGPLPGAMSVQIFTYLAQKYKAIALSDPPTLQAFQDLPHVFEQNAEYAQRAAFYRLAETWRVVGTAIAVATKRRAELHRKRRLEWGQSLASSKSFTQPKPVTDDTKRAAPHRIPAVAAVLGAITDKQQQEAQAAVDSTSNLPTPLAGPLGSAASKAGGAGSSLELLPDPDHEDEKLNLPPALGEPPLSAKEVGSSLTPGNAAKRRPSLGGSHWYTTNDLDERRAMIGSWRAPPRPPLNLDPTSAHGVDIQIPRRLDRHDSDESFAMFSASSESQHNASVPSSFASGRSHSQQQGMEAIPEQWLHPPAESSFGNLRAEEAPSAEILGKSVPVSPTTIPIGNAAKPAHPLPADQLGTGRNGSGHSADQPTSSDQALQDIQNIRRNNQLLRQDSSESEAFARSDFSQSSADFNLDMEASGTIVPEVLEAVKSPQARPGPPAPIHAPDSAPSVLQSDGKEPIQLADYQATDGDAEQESAFRVSELLKQIIAFHTSTLSDAQTSSLLILLLAPLLPQTHSLSNSEGALATADVLVHYADVFASLGLTPMQTQTVLSTQLSRLLETGINPYQAESILLTYHSQLHSLSLFNAAASLRRLAYPTYPAVYEQALKDTQLGLLCLSCKSPINNPKDKMRCETCNRAQAPCPICWGRYPAFEAMSTKKKKIRTKEKYAGHRRNTRSSFSHHHPLASALRDDDDYDAETNGCLLSPSVPERFTSPRPTLWTWCPLCGHGGHTNCLSTWFADPIMSEGACATEGCLCDCVRGSRREEKLKALLSRKAEKESKRLVRGDNWKVRESRAVGVVRGALGEREGDGGGDRGSGVGGGGTGGATAMARDGSISTGAGRRDGGDGRRVRVVVPADDEGA